MEQERKRIELMDGARGLSIFLMVFHHFFYDLWTFAGAPRWIFHNVLFDPLQFFFAGLFIFLSGVSSNFSHSNVMRGLKTLAIALGITLVTYFMDMVIVFGVLHLLGTCMLLYGLTQRFWQKLPPWVIPALTIPAIVLTARLANGEPTETPNLWMFGLVTPEFASADYFPLLPWAFVFLLGTWAGKYVREGRLPRWFYETKVPFFAPLGQKSLLIYVVHQPILYGLTMLGLRIFAKG